MNGIENKKFNNTALIEAASGHNHLIVEELLKQPGIKINHKNISLKNYFIKFDKMFIAHEVLISRIQWDLFLFKCICFNRSRKK